MQPIFDEDDERSEESSRHDEDDEQKNNNDSSETLSDESELQSSYHKSSKPVSKKSHIELTMRINRRRMFLGTVLVIIALILGVGWKLNYFSQGFSWYNSASVTLTVLEKDTHKPLAGVEVSIQNASDTTDSAGLAQLTKLTSGAVSVQLSKDGYTTKNYTTNIYRGLNPLPDAIMEKAPDKVFDITGTITDAITGGPLSKVRVAISGKDTLTDASGAFSLSAKSDAITARVTKDGFEPSDLPLKFTGTAFELVAGTLMPVRSVTFEQEKGGKTDLYQTDLSGLKLLPITNGKSASSASDPLASPDQLHLAFLSDRDGARVADSLVKKLYILDQKGVATKMSDDPNPRMVKWVNASLIAYVYQNSATPAQDTFVAINTDTKKRIVLVTPPAATTGIVVSIDAFVVSTDGRTIAYAENAYNPNNATDAPAAAAKGVFTIKPDGTLIKRIASPVDFVANLYFTKNDTKIHYTTTGTDVVTKEVDVSSSVEIVATSSVRERTYAQKLSFSDAGVATVQTKDGRYVYIDTKNGKTDIFVTALDASGDKQITNFGTVSSLSLSPDESYLLFTTFESSTYTLYVVGLDNGAPKKLAEVANSHVQFSPKIAMSP